MWQNLVYPKDSNRVSPLEGKKGEVFEILKSGKGKLFEIFPPKINTATYNMIVCNVADTARVCEQEAGFDVLRREVIQRYNRSSVWVG